MYKNPTLWRDKGQICQQNTDLSAKTHCPVQTQGKGHITRSSQYICVQAMFSIPVLGILRSLLETEFIEGGAGAQMDTKIPHLSSVFHNTKHSTQWHIRLKRHGGNILAKKERVAIVSIVLFQANSNWPLFLLLVSWKGQIQWAGSNQLFLLVKKESRVPSLHPQKNCARESWDLCVQKPCGEGGDVARRGNQQDWVRNLAGSHPTDIHSYEDILEWEEKGIDRRTGVWTKHSSTH